MSFNTYGQKKYDSGASPVQVWAEVYGVKHGGGVIEGFEALPVGSVIPAGTPVHLDKAGGTIKVLKTYEVAEDTTTAKIKLYSRFGLPNATDTLLLGEDEHTVSSVADAVDGVAEVTLSAVITAAKGDVLTDDSGIKVNGLIWHDVVKEEGDSLGTGAVVDGGRIFADRAPALPASIENELVTVKFEKGI